MNNTITGNSGIVVRDQSSDAVHSGSVHVENNTITANVTRGSLSGPGGGLLFENASGTISGNSVSNNTHDPPQPIYDPSVAKNIRLEIED